MPTIELTEEECEDVYMQLFKAYLYVSAFDVEMLCSWCEKRIVSKKTRHTSSCRAKEVIDKFDFARREYL